MEGVFAVDGRVAEDVIDVAVMSLVRPNHQHHVVHGRLRSQLPIPEGVWN